MVTHQYALKLKKEASLICVRLQHTGKSPDFLTGLLFKIPSTGENRRFDWCVLDWTNQSKSRLPLVAKSDRLPLQLTYLVQSMKHFSAEAV